MPTATFLNLPQGKRQKILRAAMEEFTHRPYGEVSLSSIIHAAEIPRGSFYQYFEDKTEIFYYVLQQLSKALEEIAAECLASCGGALRQFPPALFDCVVAEARRSDGPIRNFMDILHHNRGLDMSRWWDFLSLSRRVLDGTRPEDLEGLDGEEKLALMDLILSTTARSLSDACNQRGTVEQCREHLERKTGLLLRRVK